MAQSITKKLVAKYTRFMNCPYNLMITAHREITELDKQIIEAVISAEMKNLNLEKIYFGGAVGGDSFALETALKFKAVSSNVKLIVVLPKTIKDQRSDLRELTEKADDIIELKLSRKIHADIWWEHDKWMVINSQKCIAFWDEIPNGGTYNAMKYAERSQKTVCCVKITGRNK